MAQMSEQDQMDPKGLIRESFRIDGIDMSQCRSIFLDWALSLPGGIDSRDAMQRLLAKYEDGQPDHPMVIVLREGLAEVVKPRRRGGWRSRDR